MTTTEAPLPPMDEAVERFMRAAKQPIPDKPTIPPAKVAANRLDMLLEEVAEVCVAAGFTGLLDAAIAWSDDLTLKNRDLPKRHLEGRIQQHIEQGRYNLVETVDGYQDVKYIAQGGVLENAGSAAAKATAEEVIRNNDTKILPDGTCLKSPGGKVIKPDTRIPADVRGALIKHGAEL